MRKEPIVAFLIALSVVASGCLDISNDDDSSGPVDNDDDPSGPSRGVGAELLSNNHAVMPGEATDFVLLVENQGSHNDTFTVEVESNDGGFDIQIESGFESVMVSPGARVPLLVNVVLPNSGELYGHLLVRSQGDASVTATVRFNVSATASFGKLSAVGDTVEVQYAGILARDGVMFDTNVESIFKSDYPRLSSATEHFALLPASNIGCDGAGIPVEECEGGSGMIKGFDNRLVGMYEGQTLAVRIPARDAYGENPSQGTLGGEDLIFSVTMIDVPNHPPLAKAAAETAGPYEPGTKIWFTGAGSSDPDGDALDFFWDFDAADGDQQRIVGQGDNGRAAHTYHEDGSYSVMLFVRDIDSAEDTATVTVTIKDESTPLRAIVTTNDETQDTYRPGQPLRYDLSAAGSTAEGDITEYEWDFSYDDDDGFQVERSSNDPETEQDFESGVFVISVRITDTLGEQDEAHGGDDLELFINFNATLNETIGSGTHEYDLPVNELGLYAGGQLRYIQLRLEYDAGGSHASDLDLYLYNLTGEEVARSNTHDTSQAEQVNSILLEYYNSSHSQWFDEEGELGDWTVVVDHERSLSADPEYTLWMDVIYWEE